MPDRIIDLTFPAFAIACTGLISLADDAEAADRATLIAQEDIFITIIKALVCVGFVMAALVAIHMRAANKRADFPIFPDPDKRS